MNKSQIIINHFFGSTTEEIIKVQMFSEGYRSISSSCLLFHHSSSSQSLPVLPLIFKCYVETHLDVPCPQALLSATLSLWLQFLHAKLLGQSLSTLPPLLALLPQNLLQPHFHRNSSRKVSLKRSVVTSSPNIMLCLNIKSYIWPC